MTQTALLCLPKHRPFHKGLPTSKKWTKAPTAEGASKKQPGFSDWKGKDSTLYAHSARALAECSSELGGSKKAGKPVPCLNPDPFKRYIGPRNLGEAVIDGESTTCLLDNGAQLNFMTPAYALQRGFNIMSLDRLAREAGGHRLPPINGLGGLFVEPIGFVLVNVQVPCVQGYNEDQIMIVLDDPNMKDCPVILRTPTLFQVMQVVKESEFIRLATPWATSRLSWLFGNVSACMA